jgi:hypothetical protein
MKVKLDQIATVRTLTTFRDRAPEGAEDGNAYVLSIRDLVSRWPADFPCLPLARVDQTQLEDALRPQDILMPGRGAAYPARLFDTAPLPVLTAGQVFIIRAGAGILPTYLCWYLNTASVQAEIGQLLAGSAIQALNKSSLLRISVIVPPAAEQARIAELQALAEKRRQLRLELETLEWADIDHACHGLLGKRARHG